MRKTRKMIVHSLTLLHLFRELKLINRGISILPSFLKPKLGSTLESDLVHLNLLSDIKIRNILLKRAFSLNSKVTSIQSLGLLKQSDLKHDMPYQITSLAHHFVNMRCQCILLLPFLSNCNLITFSQVDHHINFSTGLILLLLTKERISKRLKTKSKSARED